MKFEKTEQARAHQIIVDQVCDAILTGDLRVGDLLPPEREIAAQTRMSRTSVREALKVLADAGLLAMKAGGGGGTRLVCDIIPTALLGRTEGVDPERLSDVFEIRSSLELTAAELAAARADAGQIQALEELVAQLEKLVREGAPAHELFRTIDLRFHFLIVKASGNAAMLDTYSEFTRQIALADEVVPFDRVEAEALPTMRSILAAVKSRNPAEARLAMASHIYPLLATVERRTRERRSPAVE